jgi:hypothetical protein
MTYRVATQFTHTQDVADTTWTVVHNIGGYPIMDVYINLNSELVKVLPTITFVDVNTATVTFTNAQSGFARCS